MAGLCLRLRKGGTGKTNPAASMWATGSLHVVGDDEQNRIEMTSAHFLSIMLLLGTSKL